MKRFPYRWLILCIILPPICYLMTIELLEGYFQEMETTRLNTIIVQDHKALYEGDYTVTEEVTRNIREYLGRSIKHRLGISSNILVKTRDNQILYPVQLKIGSDSSIVESAGRDLNYLEVAAENYRILNQGLIVSVTTRIRHNSWLSNSILFFYLIAAILILYIMVRKRIVEAERTEKQNIEVIKELSGHLDQAEIRLGQVKDRENDYLKNIGSLKKERKGLSTDIDELLEEIEQLETGLEGQRRLREETEYEMLRLSDELDRLKGKLNKPGKKTRKADKVQKRFKVLYKSLIFTDRAVDGFASLSDEAQLKAEEVIHRLNEDESMVPIKRKVFNKGGKGRVLEVDFFYSGRLYFQKDSGSMNKVVAIGTKNSQDQDLAYIANMK